MQENGVYLYNELYYVTKNPFLWKDSRPIPFDKMRPSMLVSAACELVLDLHDGLDEIESETTATWGKIVEPLELLYDSYSRVTSVFELLVAVNQTSELEAAVGQGMTLARGFTRRLQQSSALYASLKHLRNRPTTWLEHTHEQLQALDYWISRMEEGGANNPLWHTPCTTTTLKRLDDEEAALKRQFLNNIKQGTAAFYLTLRDGEHLRGVPRSTLAAMAAEAQMRNLTHSTGFPGAIRPPSPAPPLDGAAPTPEWGPWTVTFDRWVYESMMAYCPNRRLRQLIYQSYENRASQAPWDNVPVVESMLQVRHNRARLLGSASHTKSAGNRQMASLADANKFLDSLLPPVASAALRTMLRIVRLMMEREARGEDVWGTPCEASNLESWNTSGARLASSEVSSNTKLKYYVNDRLRPWGLLPLPHVPAINLQGLEQAEMAMRNRTLSQHDCLGVFALVTPHLRQWDLAYWAHRLEYSKEIRNQRSEPPPEDLSHYFTLSRVLSGAFELLHRLWGMHVTESIDDKPPVWHPDVRYFQMFNGSELLGSFFFDPFARANKLSVPFTQSIAGRSKARGRFPGMDRAPIAVMSTSIKAPGPSEPTLLQLSDVKAVFHEVGHVIQNLVSRNNEMLVVGTTTLPLDFFEMFGQFYELWATEDHTLTTMAQSYKTHTRLTADMRKKLAGDMTSMRPLMILEQIYMSKLDLSLHASYAANATHTALTRGHRVASDTLLLPYSANNCDFCTLMDSFGSRHGAGYYSDLWSAIFASDAMDYFEEVGISDDAQVRPLGNKMAAELLVNGMKNGAMSHYEKFRHQAAKKFTDSFIAQRA